MPVEVLEGLAVLVKLGEQLGEVGGQQPEPIYMARAEMAFAADAGAATPVLPGEVELSVYVTIQYEIA